MGLLIGLMLALVLLGMPIGFSMGIASMVYVLAMTDMSPMVVAQQICAGLDSMVLLALPFFLLAVAIMNTAGITRRLTRLAMAMIGPARGGLSYVVVAVHVLVAMVSGAAIASAAAVGSTMVPVMVRKGYPRSFAAALNTTAATVSPIIPPSVGFTIYASVSGASAVKLFLAGTVPDLLLAAGVAAVCAWIARRHGHPAGEPRRRRELAESLRDVAPALLMPVIILGGIFGGLVTPTEAGALAVGYSLLAGFAFHRSLRLRDLPRILLTTARRTAAIMFLIACASCFGFLLSREIDTERLIALFQTLTADRTLLLPVLETYQIDRVHFGVVFQLGIVVGLLTPPGGTLLFALAGVGRVSIREILRHMWPFYALLGALLLLVAFAPGLSMWLVDATAGRLR